MKKKQIIIIIVAIVLIVLSSGCGIIVYKLTNKPEKTSVVTSKLPALPKPEITGGARGELGIDKNVNEDTIDNYLGRSDSVYRDMRMLEDPATYEKIGGDRYLSGYVDGFEVVPLPYIIPVTGLPDVVGDTYTGNTLFFNNNGTYVANYKESMDIIEKLFPKDKVIFLMCGGGGYAGMMKNFLVSMGWDENKIYNVGGYWYYKGKHNIVVKQDNNGDVSYSFSKVPYHKIDFNKLTKSDDYKTPDIKVSSLKINSSDIKLEEGTSFQLNVIVLPNNASNKEIKWNSSNDSLATVTENGLVKALKPGKVTITATSIDGNKEVKCTVTITKKAASNLIKLDDISKEARQILGYDIDKYDKEFTELTTTDGVSLKPEYEENGRANDLYLAEYAKYRNKVETAINRRAEIINGLLRDKKSFIILMLTKDCEGKSYLVREGAERILTANGYSFITVGSSPYNGDETLENTTIDFEKIRGGSIAIIKDGEILVNVDPSVDSFKSDDEVKNWLSKYIELN